MRTPRSLRARRRGELIARGADAGRIVLAAALAAAALWFAASCARSREGLLTLRIETQREGALLFHADARPGDILELTWIHSVEHFPWTERFEIRPDGTLLLREIRFRGYGAGVPNERGTSVRVEGGDIIHGGIDETYPAYRWINSRTATEKITLNGRTLIRGRDLPHHEALELRIEQGR